jgi:hypothetical protein
MDMRTTAPGCHFGLEEGDPMSRFNRTVWRGMATGLLPLAALWSALPPVAASAAETGVAKVQASPSLTTGQLALSGYWRSTVVSVGGVARVRSRSTGPVLDAALPKQQPWAAAARATAVASIEAGRIPDNPAIHCFPAELPGASASSHLYQIALLIEPRHVTFLGEVHRTIRIAQMNQQHPAGLQPSWKGHSVAHWEGDTLVMDTIGLSDKNLVELGVPITSRMHIVQRIQVVNGQLEIAATFDDPGAFTGPFTVITHYERGEPFQEYICQENNLEGGVPTADGGYTPRSFGLGGVRQ